MLTVPEAAKRVGRHPETVRRWIREGRLPADRVGTQHVIDEADLDGAAQPAAMAPLPEGWQSTSWGEPMPNVVELVHWSRRGR